MAGSTKAAPRSSVLHPGSEAQETGAAAAAGAQGAAIEFDQIQGNIFGGFSKDHQLNIFVKITDRTKAIATLRPTTVDGDTVPDSLFEHVVHSASEHVLPFNEQFKALRRAGLPEGTIAATWTNIVFTAKGLTALEVVDVAGLPRAFTDGMTARASLIGDVDATGVQNAPAHWNDGMDVAIDWDAVDALIIVASDDPEQLDRVAAGTRAARYMQRLEAADSGIEVLGTIRGETRVDDVGHEHFGFKDGVSQPGIRGVDAPDDPLHNPEQGNPGQDLLHPGEFVIGYPKQIPSAKQDVDGPVDGPNPDPGEIAGEDPDTGDVLPEWAKNGSFLVFRRLAQDVKGFRENVINSANALGISPDLFGAKLVGRYRSGAPLAPLKFQSGIGEYETPLTDPGVGNPALANSAALNNDFEFGEDEDGAVVPVSAHIRKTYPRDQVPFGITNTPGDTADDAESKTQTHRLLRRGIPFGDSLGAAQGGGADDPRGLLFLAYQSDIVRQFEFVQTSWVNNANFPFPAGQPSNDPADGVAAGEDPIITNSSASGAIRGCPFHALANKSACPALTIKHFVKTRGGGYFFSPSIDTLAVWLS